MNASPRRRAGQPIAVLVALLLGWVGIRAAVWESPFPPLVPVGLVEATPGDVPVQAALSATDSLPAVGEATLSWFYEAERPITPPQLVRVDLYPLAPVPGGSVYSDRPELLASHQLLWLAAMGQVPVPHDVAKMIRSASARSNARPVEAAPELTAPIKRWSIDGWVFVRPAASLAANAGPRFASYGASQAGSVLRYRLSPGFAARPTAYVRVTKALAAGRESEIAAGLSARPIASIPLAAHAELRATHGTETTQVRPAGFVVTEIPPLDLPMGLRAETYFAAGYVGGDFATAFVDGQARIDRELVRFDLGSIRAGVGAWGGAQKGAARVDVGPSASMDVKLGTIPARVAADYRFRAAGDAEPGSGVAITISTGF